MDSTADFSKFTRQSTKGIFVIYMNLLYKLLRALWVLLFIFIQKYTSLTSENLIYVYKATGGFLLFFLIRAILIFKNFQFKIENNHFILKQGILKKKNTSIPFDRIQNINFKQNIIQQIINVYEVNIETAGSTKAEISIKALALEKAEALKRTISTIGNKTTENAIEAKEKPLVSISFLELLKVSLTENHFRSLALLLAILVGFYQQVDDVFRGIGKSEQLKSFVSENASVLKTSIIFIAFLSFFLIIVAIISSIIRVTLKHFNLKVFLKNNALEIYQGLITKKAIILRKNKVQHITVSNNPIKRILGIFFITFAQAKSGRTNKKEDKVIRIVGCKSAQVNAISNMLYPEENFKDYLKSYPENYYKQRLIFRSAILLLVINIAVFFMMDTINFFGMNIFLVPAFIFGVYQLCKKRFYQFSKENIVIGSGMIETHRTYLPFYKVQNIKLNQTIFQARRNVVDIVFQTASGKLKIPCLSIENANFIYNYALYKIESSTKSWM